MKMTKYESMFYTQKDYFYLFTKIKLYNENKALINAMKMIDFAPSEIGRNIFAQFFNNSIIVLGL